MNDANVAGAGTKSKRSTLTALFAVRRWLRETPCTSPEASVLFALASFAQPDGTDIHPGVEGLQDITKLSPAAIKDALAVWRGVSAIVKTKAGCRQRREADEYKINLEWNPSNVVPDDFCKSRRQRPLRNHKSFAKGHKSSRMGQKSSRTTPSERTSSEKAIIEKPKNPPNPPLDAGGCNVQLWQWYESILFVEMGRHTKMPNLDAYQHATAKQICDLLTRKGYPTRIDLRPIGVVPAQIPRLDNAGLHAANGKDRLNENERLGLSRFPGPRPTVADTNARNIRNSEMAQKLQPGTYEALKQRMLARGTTFDNDPDVRAVLDQLFHSVN